MGTFEVTIEVGDPLGQRWEPMVALVDTGSTFTWISGDVLRRLGVEPSNRWRFETADERIIERDVAQTWVRYGGPRHDDCVRRRWSCPASRSLHARRVPSSS